MVYTTLGIVGALEGDQPNPLDNSTLLRAMLMLDTC